MNIYLESVVIFVTFLVFLLGPVWWMDHHDPFAHTVDPDPETRSTEPGYGPFPVDTGPLLLLSEQAAALVGTEREVRALIVAAEAKIPARWR